MKVILFDKKIMSFNKKTKIILIGIIPIIFILFVLIFNLTTASDCIGDWECDYDIFIQGSSIMQRSYQCQAGTCSPTGVTQIKNCSDLDHLTCSTTEPNRVIQKIYGPVLTGGTTCCRQQAEVLLELCTDQNTLYCSGNSVVDLIYYCQDGQCQSSETVTACEPWQQCSNGFCQNQQLQPPTYHSVNELQGGNVGIVNYQYSPSDIRGGGSVSSVGYESAIMYYTNSVAATGWMNSTTNYTPVSETYQFNFNISPNKNYNQAKIRSRATHSSATFSNFTTSPFVVINHLPNMPGLFSAAQLYGGQENLISWEETSHWGNPADEKIYILEASLDGGSYQEIYQGESNNFNHYINITNSTVKYRVFAKNDFGRSEPQVSPELSINHIAPEARNLSAGPNYSPEDYCSLETSPNINLTWQYYSSKGYSYSNKSQIEISKNSNFTNPVFNQYDLSLPANSSDYITYSVPISLDFNTTYYFRVKVQSENGYWSEWEDSLFEIGKKRARPDFEWNPENPLLEEAVYFTNTTIEGQAAIVSWYWEFQNALIEDSSLKDPITEFKDGYGIKRITLTVRDVDGVDCSVNKDINFRPQLPDWEEVGP